MATTVRRRVTYIKVKKGQVKRKRPSTDVVRTGASDKSAETFDDGIVSVRVRPAAKPWWKMAWIPLVALLVIGVFFSLAMGVGDNLRKTNEMDLSSDEEDDGPRSDLSHKKVAYPGAQRETTSNGDNRRKPTNSSFLATHYNKNPGGASAGGGNGGVPQSGQGSQAANKAPAKSGAPSANCVLSYGGNTADLSQRLGDCLGKQ